MLSSRACIRSGFILHNRLMLPPPHSWAPNAPRRQGDVQEGLPHMSAPPEAEPCFPGCPAPSCRVTYRCCRCRQWSVDPTQYVGMLGFGHNGSIIGFVCFERFPPRLSSLILSVIDPVAWCLRISIDPEVTCHVLSRIVSVVGYKPIKITAPQQNKPRLRTEVPFSGLVV